MILKIFKKQLLYLLLFLIFPLFSISAYSFQESSGLKETAEKTGHTNQSIFNTAGSLDSGIGLFISILLSFLGVIFMVLIIYGGILWMTAGGNDQQIEKARKILINSIIGLAIVLLAYAISVFVIGQFSGQLN